MTSTHAVHVLPKSHPNTETWAGLIRASKTFRLQALQTSPESFSSTYAREAAFTDHEWEARLQNSLALTLVAVKTPATESSQTGKSRNTAEDLLDLEWKGSAVLFGPLPQPSSPANDNKIPTFEIFALFVLPSARGYGMGASLIQAVIGHASSTAADEHGSGEVVVKVTVTPGNMKVVGLYEKLGFRVMEGEEGLVAMELRCKK
ncbi:hypothetical protein K458DRAFT_412314 [Lentithecium fluviatile CBS 122367]|uniref:N-acetyltransferase domain-containing protein n=1 Tax=Lentithecium fluviatile CBS 122367 TaxID=1168545 RepID=A0A6G1JLG6_9PLEO|nr:hypothetical protein K458DRAFT_412314 [Lentithecium fluviatile CBS 122367]